MAGKNLNEKQFRSFLIYNFAKIQARAELNTLLLNGMIERQRNIVSSISTFPIDEQKQEEYVNQRIHQIVKSLE